MVFLCNFCTSTWKGIPLVEFASQCNLMTWAFIFNDLEKALEFLGRFRLAYAIFIIESNRQLFNVIFSHYGWFSSWTRLPFDFQTARNWIYCAFCCALRHKLGTGVLFRYIFVLLIKSYTSFPQLLFWRLI